jgi:endonuclease/exonuclease/phosphatase family metal-dependent hydrolase
MSNWFIRRRDVHGEEAREPTLLALVLAVLGLVTLLVLCCSAIIALPSWGYAGWVFAAVAAVLAWLVLRRRGQPVPAAATTTGRQKWASRIRGFGRRLFTGVLAAWLGLIAWSEVCPGGPPPAPKSDQAQVRVVTWNIHCGQEHGLPWQRFDWPARKRPLRRAIEQAAPDILCVQEARPGQVAFLERVLPGHSRTGTSRTDGEHCAIYFNRERFEEIEGGTFGLGAPVGPFQPGPRICTWVRLRDRDSGQVVRIYNTHQYLLERGRGPAARLIREHVAAGDPTDAVLLTADFNAGPTAPSRRRFAEVGLADSAGSAAGAPTIQLYGIGVRNIDGILVSPGWRVHNHRVLNVKPGRVFPSDHFGVLADLSL